MKKIYIAGPMTGRPDFNYPAFHLAAEQLRAKGCTVENPAENDLPPGREWHEYLRNALTKMLTCDAVAVLHGWESSKGAALEVHVARALGMPVKPLADVVDFACLFIDKNQQHAGPLPDIIKAMEDYFYQIARGDDINTLERKTFSAIFNAISSAGLLTELAKNKD